MKRHFQVFISSTFEDLKQERQVLVKAILELGHLPSGMELFPASDDASWRLIREVIDESDYYVLIIGGRYGSLDEAGISYTEREYDHAHAQHKPVIALLHERPDDLPRGRTDTNPRAWTRLASFRNKIEQRHTCAYWTTPEELRSKLIASLTSTMQTVPATGWVRATTENPTPRFYSTLYDASGDIVRSIRSAVLKQHTTPLSIYVLGGRIRTIAPMLEQVLDDIESAAVRARDTIFTVCCFKPDEMPSWVIPGTSDLEACHKKLTAQAEELRLQTTELLRYNELPVFRRNRVEVRIVHYGGFPTIYGFVIGESEIYWGYYTWNQDKEDFDGPPNPCVYMDNSMEHFGAYRHWLLNRVALYQVAAGDSSVLDHILDLNRRAYDSLAGEYDARATARVHGMRLALEPLHAELRRLGVTNATVLDIGCGDGMIAKELAAHGYQVTGIDFSRAMCRCARRRVPEGVTILQQEFLGTDFRDARFDCVVAVAFVHLFPPPWDVRVLKKMRSLLSKDGIAFVVTTVHDHSQHRYERKIGFRHQPLRFRDRYEKDEFTSLLKTAGFEICATYETEDTLQPQRRWMNFIVRANADSLVC